MREIQLGAHTVKSHGVKLARAHMHDWLILVLLLVIVIILNMIHPFYRFVAKDMMDDLKHPWKSNKVPVWAVPIIAVLLPVVIFIAFYYRRRDVYDLHHAILGLLFSVFITAVITDAIKDGVGRPRPDFFWRCFPDGKELYDQVTGNVICHGEEGAVKEGHKSFPSGHTSWSFAGLSFLSLYLSGKIKAFDRRGHVAKLCIVFLPLLIASLVGVSRVDDYRHHWQDVFAGGILGIVVAAFCYLQFFPAPHHTDGWGTYAYFQMLESRGESKGECSRSRIAGLQTSEDKMANRHAGVHTIKSHGLKVAKFHMHDWLILLLLGGLEVGLNVIDPFYRFVGEDMMTDLKNPLKDNTVPFWAVPLIAIVLPVIIFIAIYFKRRDVYDLHHAILGLLFSVLVTGVITDAVKDAVGRPRPDFFWRCFPDGKSAFDPVTGGVICHGLKSVIKEGHKSFPSGHSSWSFAGLGFLSWYLSGKIRAFDQRGHVAKLCIVFLPLLVAALVGVSRVDDYWHHWQDVFAGGLLGLTVSSFCYLQFFPLPYDSEGWGPHAFFRSLAEREGENENGPSISLVEPPVREDEGEYDMQGLQGEAETRPVVEDIEQGGRKL